jgi:hypothetical protein
MSERNEKNVRTGQQSRTEPWKGPGRFDDGTPRQAPDVVEQENNKAKNKRPAQREER